jgi:hypothetical protein
MNATLGPVERGAKHLGAPVESLTVIAPRLVDALEQDVRDFLVTSDENLGDIEVKLEQQSRELLRAAAEKAVCHKALSQLTGEHRRSTLSANLEPSAFRGAGATANGAASGAFRPIASQTTGSILDHPRDESLLCLETFWRNGRWSLLFPHNRQFDPSKN